MRNGSHYIKIYIGLNMNDRVAKMWLKIFYF